MPPFEAMCDPELIDNSPRRVCYLLAARHVDGMGKFLKYALHVLKIVLQHDARLRGLPAKSWSRKILEERFKLRSAESTTSAVLQTAPFFDAVEKRHY